MAAVLPDTCEYAAARGVEVNLENLPLLAWSRDSQAILHFIRAQGLPNLGFILDAGHAHANGEDHAALIRAAGPLLRDTHFHDNLGPRGFDFTRTAAQADISSRDLHMIPGMGTIDWIGVVRALWAVDFPGPVVFEAPRIPGYPDRSATQWGRAADLAIRMWRVFEEAADYCPDP
jgi:sugar phosphate isomerase/epimerase